MLKGTDTASNWYAIDLDFGQEAAIMTTTDHAVTAFKLLSSHNRRGPQNRLQVEEAKAGQKSLPGNAKVVFAHAGCAIYSERTLLVRSPIQNVLNAVSVRLCE